MNRIEPVTRERLLDILHYEPLTGQFTWRHRSPTKSELL